MAELADAPDLGSGADRRMSSSLFARRNNEVFVFIDPGAGIAHLVERSLAKAEVAGSSPVSRSIPEPIKVGSGMEQNAGIV